jgi:hypothetical protein
MSMSALNWWTCLDMHTYKAPTVVSTWISTAVLHRIFYIIDMSKASQSPMNTMVSVIVLEIGWKSELVRDIFRYLCWRFLNRGGRKRGYLTRRIEWQNSEKIWHNQFLIGRHGILACDIELRPTLVRFVSDGRREKKTAPRPTKKQCTSHHYQFHPHSMDTLHSPIFIPVPSNHIALPSRCLYGADKFNGE